MLVPYLNAMSQPKTDFESDCYVDAALYLYQDKGKTFAVVKRSYRNVDLRKQVIGLTIIDTSNLMPLDKRYTWPMWDSIESIHNGAVLIKKENALMD